jgi:hypothetical protein
MSCANSALLDTREQHAPNNMDELLELCTAVPFIRYLLSVVLSCVALSTCDAFTLSLYRQFAETLAEQTSRFRSTRKIVSKSRNCFYAEMGRVPCCRSHRALPTF